MRSGPIDLRSFRDPLNLFFQQSVDAFLLEHGTVTLCSVAFYVFPYGRYGAICFDTPENSEKIVTTWQHNGPAWYGEDSSGRFNNSPEDFEFLNFAEFEFEGFPDLYHEDDPLEFIDSTGTHQDGNREAEGDEGIKRAMFPTLRVFVREFAGWTLLPRSALFRVGVVMHDSLCTEFWR